jgi:hypothetical protein
LGFAVGNDGRLYAFTAFAAMEYFSGQQRTPQMPLLPPEYSIFYQDINYSGQNQLGVPPSTSIFYLSTYGMDNMISSMKISSYADNGCTLFADGNLQGDYFAVNGGTNWSSLVPYGWNDIASSLVVWPQ